MKIHYRREPKTACGRYTSLVRSSSYYSAVTCGSCIKIVDREANVLIDKILREPAE